jgi:hypothetical protein
VVLVLVVLALLGLVQLALAFAAANAAVPDANTIDAAVVGIVAV